MGFGPGAWGASAARMGATLAIWVTMTWEYPPAPSALPPK
ncbi:MAG: hypothetical protein GF320_05510 [Armatimonadia bacterium]|nr:hypothetical protein [Armatimonadia bacterium]